MDLEADIEILLADFGKPMTFGTLSGKCLVDVTDQDILPTITSAIGETRVGTIRTSAFPGLVVGSSVTVDGQPYVIRDRKRISDGLLTFLELGAP